MGNPRNIDAGMNDLDLGKTYSLVGWKGFSWALLSSCCWTTVRFEAAFTGSSSSLSSLFLRVVEQRSDLKLGSSSSLSSLPKQILLVWKSPSLFYSCDEIKLRKWENGRETTMPKVSRKHHFMIFSFIKKKMLFYVVFNSIIFAF